MKEFYYKGNDLGAIYTKGATSFRVWAPTAEAVELLLYDEQYSGRGAVIAMNKAEEGTWYVVVSGDLKNKFYQYGIYFHGRVNHAVDPYARCLSVNGLKGMVVDLEETNPPDWDKDVRPPFARTVDAIIYELHVRDFSIAAHSGMMWKGKYLAFTETRTRGPEGVETGIDHLKALGITHVHLMPVQDFGSVDETKELDYNWGYDPEYYNSPEGSYASDARGGAARVSEFKQMVKALHAHGIRVVLDVVYNHTYHVGDSAFDLIVPKYYYRTDMYGNYTNGSGCGNETASEKPMMRKFILDSLKYWVEEYHVDGFRFDLMGLHDVDTMREVEQMLHGMDPSILIYGEPWTGGWSPLDDSRKMLKGAQRGMHISVFNDEFRNAIKGGTEGWDRGYATGEFSKMHQVMVGLVASTAYNSSLTGFAQNPDEVVNYTSNHDNLCLFDKIEKSNTFDNADERIRMHKLANTIVLTSQGMAFIQAGDEMLRTKYGNHNSYNAGDIINAIDWERKARHLDIFHFYSGLIRLRRAHPAFRMPTAEMIRKHLSFMTAPQNIIAFLLADHANDDPWKDIVVIYNPTREMKRVILPYKGKWHIVVNGSYAVGDPGEPAIVDFADDYALVAPLSAMVLYSMGD